VNDHGANNQVKIEQEDVIFDAAESENAAALGWLIEAETLDANT